MEVESIAHRPGAGEECALDPRTACRIIAHDTRKGMNAVQLPSDRANIKVNHAAGLA